VHGMPGYRAVSGYTLLIWTIEINAMFAVRTEHYISYTVK